MEQQVIVSMFILQTVQDGTISQFKLTGTSLLDELFAFVKNQEIDGDDDEDEEQSLMDRVSQCCRAAAASKDEVG